MNNDALIAGTLVVLLAAGIYLVWKGFQPRDLTKPRRRTLNDRVTINPRTRNLAIIGAALGILTWIITGYAVTVVLVPLLFIIGPTLFSNSAANTEIERLTAMEEWMRNLSGIMAVGAGLEQAILATGKSVPRALDTEINALLSRLRHGVPIRECLDKFATDLDDSTGDMLVGMLKLASKIRGSGLPAFLNNAAASVADDVRGRRAAETARSGPRTEARWVSILAVGFLTALFFLSNFMEPYKTPTGQIVLVILLGTFIGCLLWMRLITRPTKLPRFIGTPDRANYRGTTGAAHRRTTRAANATARKATP